MKKLYYSFAVLCILISINNITAQSKSEKLLNDVSTKMSNFDNMHIKFNWVLENKEVDLKQEVAGTVYTQNEKYHLEFMGNIFMYDNENNR